jgi:spore germination protein
LDWKKHKNKIGYAVLAIALIGAVVWAGVTGSRAQSLEQQLNSGYSRGYNDLIANLENLETSLSKLQVTSTPRQYTLQLMDIWRQCGETKGILNTLPVSQVVMGDVSAFVTRMGDYCYMLGQKVTSGAPVTGEDLEQIGKLHETCVQVYLAIREEFEANKDRYAQLTAEGFVKVPGEGESMAKLSKDNTEYPHLVYDGPYSESRDEQTPKSLKNEAPVDEATAEKTAKAHVGGGLAGGLERMDDLKGMIECYAFRGTVEDSGNEVYVYVTKRGGKVLLLSQTLPPAETVVPDEKTLNVLEQAGANYLAAHGYGRMKATYSQYYDGQAVINFAAVQDGVILYPDLVKVGIMMDGSKRVVGVDARNYIMAHQDRTLKAVNLSAEEARAIINPSLEITGERLALIPAEDMTERLCYEFAIRKDETDYLVYIDAVNGEEAEILKIIDTNEGSLVM